MLLRLKYNRVHFPKKIKGIDNDIFVDAKNLSKEEIIQVSTKKMKKYGSVVLNQYFNEEILKQFEKEYKSYFESIDVKPSNHTSRSDFLPLSKILNSIWLDKSIITIMEKYI